MRLKFFFSTLALMLALFAAAANAQQVTSTTEAPRVEPVKVSGTMYLEWVKTMENRLEAENVNTFRIQRVYLDFRKKIDDVWSARATLDVGNDNGATDTRYQAYIKYAYLQGAFNLGFGTLTAQFGMIGTPVIGLIDSQSDYRWLNQNYIDAAKALLYRQSNATGATPGQSIDSSADLGLSLSLKVASMVTITGAITNGEGYKTGDELAAGDDGKAMYGMLTVTPISGLFLSGFYMNRVTDDAEAGDNYVNYYGANAIYVFQGIRVGVSYVMAKVSTFAVGDPEAEVAEYTLIDAFIMANLKGFTGMPILLAGRYAMGSTEYAEGYGASNGFTSDVTIWAVGVGYQFNDNVRVMAYLEDQSSSSSDIAAREWDNSNRNFYVKAEAKL
ncbi:MAG: hypothetical protein KBA61_00990 [Spirochaetes bacterium]|nr:hypothetical protein [Spirochaetota bacterium]